MIFWLGFLFPRSAHTHTDARRFPRMFFFCFLYIPNERIRYDSFCFEKTAEKKTETERRHQRTLYYRGDWRRRAPRTINEPARHGQRTDDDHDVENAGKNETRERLRRTERENVRETTAVVGR